MILGHRIRLDPTVAQQAFFRRCCGTARFTWNWALHEAMEHYKATGKSCDLLALKKRWNAEKPTWVKETPRDCNSQPFYDLIRAYSNFFQGLRNGQTVGLPLFKKRGQHDAFYLANDAGQVDGLVLWVPRLGWVRMTEALRWQGKIMSFRITRQADKWFVSIAVEVGEHRRARTSDGTVGVDLGIKTLAVTSDGQAFASPMPLRKATKKMARLQRIVSRRVKGSARRAKARMAVARLHMRIGNIRRDVLHKVSSRLCRENQTVVIENLNVAGMVKNRKLARAVSDMGWGELRRQLEYKGPLHGTTIIVADRWFPSSKTCSACGAVVDALPLSVREWACLECGVVHDRDQNAAMNLRTLGLRETTGASQGNARGQIDRCPRISRGTSRLGEARSATCPQGDKV